MINFGVIKFLIYSLNSRHLGLERVARNHLVQNGENVGTNEIHSMLSQLGEHAQEEL